ncbi:hypothetical protein A2U01_0001814, partial [Trifolium medium]|nr:hypothetical protein [Trifolium medium]
GAFDQSWNLFQKRSFKGQTGHILNSIKKILHVFETLNGRVGWSFWRVNCKDLIVHHLEDSTGIVLLSTLQRMRPSRRARQNCSSEVVWRVVKKPLRPFLEAMLLLHSSLMLSTAM